MDELFAPPGEAWQRVSPQLSSLHRTLVLAASAGVLVLGTVAAAFVPAGAAVAAVAVVSSILVAATGWELAGRHQRAWGYAERAEDLFVTSGVMFRQLVAVPYGRMQFVDVTAGPLERAFGVATVRLHTATTATNARIPGLPPGEAARLRDRLTELGEARAAGL